MAGDGLRQFGEALADRRAGRVAATGPDALFAEVKPEFYADAYGLSDNALHEWQRLKKTHAPYGLVAPNGKPITQIRQPGQSDSRRWQGLERALAGTARFVFDRAKPSVSACPYAPVLRETVGVIPPVQPQDDDAHGIDTLRGATLPGAVFAPTLVVNLVRRMHMLKQLHGARATHWDLAHNSAKGLLDEPLRHPQQWAKAFMFTLAEGMDGEDKFLLRETFLDEATAEAYAELRTDPTTGREVIGWALPTEDFALRAAVGVADRTRGHETTAGDHQQVYPIGTRLGDIEVTEPTIKCPGFRMAYAMWDTAVDVAVRENLWTNGF